MPNNVAEQQANQGGEANQGEEDGTTATGDSKGGDDRNLRVVAAQNAERTRVIRVAGRTEPAAGRFAKLSLATNQPVAFVDVQLGDRVEKGWQVFSHWE